MASSKDLSLFATRYSPGLMDTLRYRTLHESDTASRVLSFRKPRKWATAPEPIMAERTKAPFRADHVGSLIPPDALINASERADRKEISDAELKRIQHAA